MTASVERACALELEVAEGAAEEAIELWLQIAAWHQDPAAQADCYRRVLSRRPDEPRALEALAELYECAEDWEHAARLLSKLADSMGESPRRIELEHRVGCIAYQELKDDRRAEDHFLQAFTLRASHLPSVRALVQIYRERGDWESAAEILTQSAADVENKSLRLSLLLEAACLHRDHLRAPRAIELLKSALVIDAGHLPAVEALADIYYRERRWEQATPLLEQLEADDALSAAGAVQVRGRLKRARTAVEDRRSAACSPRREEPEAEEDELELDEDQTLMDLDLGLVEPDEAVARVRAKLQQDPRHVPSYRALRAIFTDQGRHDQAWCVCAAMTYLGCASPRERVYYETYKSRQAGQNGEMLTAEMWNRVVHPAVDSRVDVITDAIGRELALIHARPLRHHGLSPKKRRDTDNDQLALSRALGRAATLLNVPLPDLYLKPDRPGQLSLENVVHHKQLLPSLVARGNALRGRSLPELAYMAGYTLAFLLRRDFFLLIALPSEAELLATLDAAIELARSVARVRAGSEPAVDSARTSLEKALSSRARAELELAVNGSGVCFGNFDIATWRQAVEITAQRIGLILCGDPGVAVRTLAAETAPAGAATRAAECDQLLLYSVSEDYFAVRRHLNGTIGAARCAAEVRSAA